MTAKPLALKGFRDSQATEAEAAQGVTAAAARAGCKRNAVQLDLAGADGIETENRFSVRFIDGAVCFRRTAFMRLTRILRNEAVEVGLPAIEALPIVLLGNGFLTPGG